ncbi:serine hydrolase domain-containing protein [Pedobacter cryotolerans]|uniref:Beta-lactamase family protein n=1 Tax=Pedobacter cryotolerans TaxID=2571270 RepID=A0A4U1C3W8_9SPHI|nr:serine hydrolase domain-containing protein [Pedobacter cryotolerans]TKB99879.1 beta-lactamase family protein [Pedobacter cryotolerans]
MKKLLSFSFTIFLFTSSFAQNFNSANLDSLFNILAAYNKYMGNVAVAKNGKTIYAKAIGKADIETGKDANTDSKYRIGSISKTFTATLIFKAIEEKKLTLNQSINTYFPNVKNANKITIGNLLNHRSGIFNLTNDPNYLKLNTIPKSRTELVNMINATPSIFEPNSKSEYSNSNYVILSIILEKIYKKTYPEILTEKIINQLKLKNTYYGAKINLANNEVNSYAFTGIWLKQPETDMSIPLGAGGIVSNPADLNTFIAALLNGKLVTLPSVELMKTIKDNYGMGLTKIPFYDHIGFGHGGAIDGFTSLLYYFPTEQLSVAITSNGNNYDNNQILIALLSAYYNKPFDIPSFTEIAVKAEDLDQYLGTYGAANFPMKIAITKKENILIAQATGQGPLELKATAKNTFEFIAAGIVLEFNPAIKQMLLKQGGGKYTFTKE